MLWKFVPKTLSIHVFADVQPSELERTVQAWLQDNPGLQVMHTAQSQNGTGLATLTIFYVKQ